MEAIRLRVALLASAELNDHIGAAVAGRSGKDALVALDGHQVRNREETARERLSRADDPARA